MNGKFIVLNKKVIIKLCFLVLVMFGIFTMCTNSFRNILEVTSSNRLLPIYSVETDKNKVALTFDCAWGANDIPQIIETLNKNNVKATFFTVGDWVVKNPEVVEQLNEAGMEIR